jgi:hypothetical protein
MRLLDETKTPRRALLDVSSPRFQVFHHHDAGHCAYSFSAFAFASSSAEIGCGWL